MLRFIARKRITDRWGQGSFGASRDGGKRTHVGVDYAAWPGSVLLSPVMGTVTKLGYPYADHMELRYVQVTDDLGRDHRFFYVDPAVHTGMAVGVGDRLGKVQALDYLYEGITPHVHYECRLDGEYINPEEL